MITRALPPGTKVRSALTDRLGTVRDWDPDAGAYLIRWENYDFTIHCRTTHLVDLR